MFYQKCLNILKNYVEIIERIFPELSNYFDMIQEDFSSYVISDGESTIITYMFSTLNSLIDRKRAGWVQLGVPEAESIMEHIYSAWLIGLLFLPENDEKHDDYSKAIILQMLLIHDMAKPIIIDDINNLEKTGDRERYNQIEDHTMKKLLLKGTYPDMGNLYPYIEIWNKWMEGTTFNAKIAKEIDIIQRLYMLMHYHLKHPKEVTDHDVEEWFSIYVPTIQTDIGQELLRRVVEKKS
jgi:5'-deoxynucleotidase YfbR-like HD superfamily hydrolase